MPRLPPSLFRQAYRISPCAAALLPACRDLPSALNELRWIRESVDTKSAASGSLAAQQRLWHLCRRRGRGEPLQYVLGTQPFGNLEIKCRPGVLIPRPEPEAYTLHLASLLKAGLLLPSPAPGSPPAPLFILDLCTGTGCIALLLFAQLSPSTRFARRPLHITGLDISPRAVALARANQIHNRLPSPSPSPSPAQQHTLRFARADMFAAPTTWPAPAPGSSPAGRWDVLTCNPPYVSRAEFARTTARSVRNHEPRLAQVPEAWSGFAAAVAGGVEEDVFYARLLEVAGQVGARVVLCEVGGEEQARRVVGMVLGREVARGEGVEVEVWGEEPDGRKEEGERESLEVGGREVAVRGCGRWRAVFIHRKGGL